MTVACLVSAIAVALFYFIGKRKIQSPKGHIKPLITTSLPITFSRTTSSVNNYIIAIAVPFLLMTSGLNSEQSMYIFGSCVGMALPLLYLPITVVGVACVRNDPLLCPKRMRTATRKACAAR